VKKLILIYFLITLSSVVLSQTDSLISDLDITYKKYKYSNGKIASKGLLKNDQPYGLWKSYYLTGILKSEGKWINNQLDSVWIFYDQLGDTSQKINYFQGKKNGYHYRYFKDENLKTIIASKELYINGKRNDKSLYYFKTGSLRMIVPYMNDLKQGIGFEYDANKNITAITRYRNNEIVVQENINRLDINGKKTGIWKEFYENGVLKKEKNYLDGKLNGYLKLYTNEGKLVESIKYKNGEIDLVSNDFDSNIEIKEKYDINNNLIFQGSYNRNVPIGVHRYFNNNGSVSKSKIFNINGKLIAEGIVLINGKETGDWVYYYETGKTQAQGKFINGKKTSNWKYYYPSGSIQQVGSYSGGNLTGMWKWYYETSELLKEEYYIYGHLDGEATEYSELGNIISKGNYIEDKKEGEWIYVIGDQKYVGNYVGDFKNREWRSYYIDTDIISFEGRFLHGSPDGKHEYYYPDGSLKEERYFDGGMKVKSWTKYDERGDLIIVVQYKDGKEFKINGEKVKLHSNED
jgi:antitoxin component YwqK of YwqJK toxin-antitoxin module